MKRNYYLLVLFLFVLLIANCDRTGVNVIFYLSSDLSKNEPGEAEIRINDEYFKSLDRHGDAKVTYKANPGEVLDVKFKKIGYIAQTDFQYTVKIDNNKINRVIRFKKPKVKPEPVKVPQKVKPQSVSTKIVFVAENNLSGVEIYLGDEILGKTNNTGKFQWEITTVDTVMKTLNFKVLYDGDLKLNTMPKDLSFVTGKKSIVKNIKITGHVIQTPVIELTMYNKADNAPLKNIKVKFSDSEEILITGQNGLLRYQIKENRYMSSVGLEIIEPKNLIIDSGYEPIVIRPELPQTIKMEVFGQISFVIRFTVENFTNDKLKGVKITVDKKDYKTNNRGNVSIPINSLTRTYEIKLSKSKYEDFTTTVTPIEQVTDLSTIRLKGITAYIFVQDSLSRKVIPYVKIIEKGEVLERTDANGRAQIAVYLNTPTKLEFVPRSEEEYSILKKELIFHSSGETKVIRLLPRPYEFNWNFINQDGAPLEDVMIRYGAREYHSDNRGKVTIETHRLAGGEQSKEEWFEFSYRGYSDKYPVDIETGKKVYNIRKTISSTLQVTISSVPPGADVIVYNAGGNIVTQGTAPFNASIEPGFYRIHGKMGELSVDKTENISKNDQNVTLNMEDPIAKIIQLYQEQKYRQVVEFYDQPMNQQNINRKHPQYCQAMNAVYVSYGKLDSQEHKKKAVGIGEQMYNDQCIAEIKPWFLKNLAYLYSSISEWDKADEYYELANMERYLVKDSRRAEFYADCLYYRVVARVEFAGVSSNFINESEKRLYLQKTGDLLTEFEQLAVSHGLDYRNYENLNRQIKQGEIDAGSN